jgi:hypothetical protein
VVVSATEYQCGECGAQVLIRAPDGGLVRSQTTGTDFQVGLMQILLRRIWDGWSVARIFMKLVDMGLR